MAAAAVANPFHVQSSSMYSSPPPSPPSSPGASGDWKHKYYEVSDLLAETRAELDEFTKTSRELEEELERDLERTEKAQEELRQRVSKVEAERDEWKTKFMSLQHNHNTAVNSLQRELDATRQSVHLYKAQVRELEMGNDDLERNERQATSSLVDVEQKYAKALEDKILLEHELQDKLVLEETCQRLRDELRDATVEATVLKDQLEQAKALPLRPALNERQTSSNSSLPLVSPTGSEHESLMRTTAPSDLTLADLMPSASSSRHSSLRMSSRLSHEVFDDEFGTLSSRRGSPTSFTSARTTKGSTSTPTQRSFLERALSPPALASASTSANTRLPLPTPRRKPVAPSPSPVPSPAARGIPVRTTVAAKSKGVQMVSEMRARVRTLEQRIHANMPRIRSQSNMQAGRVPSRGTTTTTTTTTTPAGLRTPTKKAALSAPTVNRDPASPWVMVADEEGDADVTLRFSPEKPPRLPPVPAMSPMVANPRLSESHSTPLANRPPSRSAIPAPRSTSALGTRDRSVSTMVTKRERDRSPGHPPTAFPSRSGSGPARPSSASASTNIFKVPTTNTRGLVFSVTGGIGDPDSPTHNVGARPTTPTKLLPKTGGGGAGLRRNHTISSPTRPPTISPPSTRQRNESMHASKSGSTNTTYAGTTPGRGKAPRSVTTPPPPLPSLPHATAKNAVLGPRARPGSYGFNSQRLVKDAFGDAGLLGEEEEATVKAKVLARSRAGTVL